MGDLEYFRMAGAYLDSLIDAKDQLISERKMIQKRIDQLVVVREYLMELERETNGLIEDHKAMHEFLDEGFEM